MTADHNSHNSHNRHATPSDLKTVRNPKINLGYVALLRRARREESTCRS